MQVFQLWRERYSCSLESRNSTTLTLYNKPHRIFFFEREKVKSLSASPLPRSIWELSRRQYLANVSLAHVELSRVSFGVFSSSELGPSTLYGRAWLPVSEGVCLPIRAVRLTSVWTLVVGDPQWWDLANSMLQRTFILLFLFTVQSLERFVTLSFRYILLNLRQSWPSTAGYKPLVPFHEGNYYIRPLIQTLLLLQNLIFFLLLRPLKALVPIPWSFV